MKGGWKSGNACYSFVHNLVFFSLRSENVKTKGYGNIISFYSCVGVI
jgi:hypothetical protein